MAAVFDFRLSLFDISKVEKSGKLIGKQTFWKLYSIENIFRVVIHSVLSVQLPPDWWALAVDKTTRDKAQRFQDNYLKKAWHGKPGAHHIYYIDLKDLNEIMRANSHLFKPVVPDFDKWILGIEELRLPRNVVAHMNYPSATDKARVDVFYDDCKVLVAEVQKKLALKIP